MYIYSACSRWVGSLNIDQNYLLYSHSSRLSSRLPPHPEIATQPYGERLPALVNNFAKGRLRSDLRRPPDSALSAEPRTLT